jgi:formate hydrogenlyase transcriptional activator
MSVIVQTEPDREAKLEERLQFETLLADLSSRFVNVPPDQVDREIAEAQSRICECLGIDHSALWQASPDDPKELFITHLHRSRDLAPPPDRAIATEMFPWALGKIAIKQIVCVSAMADLPAEAARDRETWLYYGIKSALVFPLSAGGGPVFGSLSFDATQKERDWPEALQKRLEVIAQVFANALARKQSDETLRESEMRLSLAADSANAGLWTLVPETGQIWATKKAFELFGLPWAEDFTLEKFLDTVHPEDREAVQGVINDAMRSGKETSTEFRIVRPDGTVRWIASRGRRQSGKNGHPDRLMGVDTDVTGAKEVELELKKLRERLQAETDYLREEIRVYGRFDEIVGQSTKLKKVFQRIEQVAPTDSTVLITGETGTGKELVSRAIHNLSRRSPRVMVKVDCASLPATLIESELFGREKGAYTGALTKQAGRFELADGSTLFLDEIGELSLELQAKLLRVLEDGQFERLGSPKTISVDVRVIAATHRDLAEKVKDGTFRQDLYYRLNVFPVQLPPLRERPEDIPSLVWSFVGEFEKQMGKKVDSIPKRVMDLLQNYSWPGNIRELRNVIEQAVIVSSGGQLYLDMPTGAGNIPSPTLKEAERQHIVSVLSKTDWRIKGPAGAARLLGMNSSTLYSAMRRLGIPNRNGKSNVEA